MGLFAEELAVETNDSTTKVLGEVTLQKAAQELVRAVRASLTFDWTMGANARAQRHCCSNAFCDNTGIHREA